MEKVDVKLVNCYGIKKLEYCFDFSKKHHYLLYASNGMMKTSFTKTFRALSNGKKPSDEVFQRKTTCSVLSDGHDISRDEIFVISSYEDEYISPNSAKLMVRKELRAKYDEAITNVDVAKTTFFNAVKELLVQEDDTIILLSDFLECTPIDIIENLNKLINENFLDSESFSLDFSQFKYGDIFSADVQKFVSDTKNLDLIKEYEARYNELLEKSPIYKRGVFSHNNADIVSENLATNGFFNAEHKIVLHGIEKEISSAQDFTSTINTEKEKIFSDENLRKKFDKINTALGKKALIKFRSAIERNEAIIPQLSDFSQFKRKVWCYILNQVKEPLSNMLTEYQLCQKTIEEIKTQAKIERTQWDNVLEVFKARFSAPFTIDVPNKDDVAFADRMPEFIFKYIDPETNEETEIPRKNLEKILSQGEKRALFLLNIINDLEALKLTNKNCLIIADDIAESFDYKNKYAIIEYLQEMMQSANFRFIVLTHNFDFYRTVANRSMGLIEPKMVQRIQNGIEIVNPKYVFKNPFSTMKVGMLRNNDNDIITAIPFVRNLIEYTRGDDNDDYKLLTSLLHLKSNTKDITLKQLEDTFNSEIKGETSLTFSSGRENDKVHHLILKLAKDVSQNNRESIDLTGKIIISMAIRLLAEEYMIKTLTDDYKKPVPIITGGNQTPKLLESFRSAFPDKEQQLKTLNRVLLMSSENIHINSFMFEPLIDMSIKSLIDLYGEISILMV